MVLINNLVARPRRLERLTSTFGGLHSIQTELRAQRINVWCPRGDSNPYGITHSPLKRARLPFRHLGTGRILLSCARFVDILQKVEKRLHEGGVVAVEFFVIDIELVVEV